MSALELPRSEGPKNYVEATEVNFKPRDGKYQYWDGVSQIETKSVSGVVVYTAMQFMGDKVVSKSRAVTYVSDPFTWDDTKDGKKIRIKCKTREDGKTSYQNVGDFSYAQIRTPEFAAQYKVAKFRMFNVVFVYDPDADSLKKILFSPVVGRIVGKGIASDQPNFVTTFGVSNEIAIKDDNGDYYAPTVSKSGPSPLDKVEKISAKISDIHRIIAKQGMAIPTASSKEDVFHSDNEHVDGKATQEDPFPFGG